MNVVIDASVSIKWFVPDDGMEEDADKAIYILKSIQTGNLSPVNPFTGKRKLSRFYHEFKLRSVR